MSGPNIRSHQPTGNEHLVTAMTRDTGFTRQEVQMFIEAYGMEVRNQLVQGRRINLPGTGWFTIGHRALKRGWGRNDDGTFRYLMDYFYPVFAFNVIFRQKLRNSLLAIAVIDLENNKNKNKEDE